MTDETWPCRACGMSLRDCTEEPDPLGVCCSACGQAARGNHREYEWTCEGHGCGVCALCTQPKPENEPTQAALIARESGHPPVRVRGARTYSNTAGSVSEALRTAADHILLHEHQNPGLVTCDAFSLWFDPSEEVWCVGYTLEGCAEEDDRG